MKGLVCLRREVVVYYTDNGGLKTFLNMREIIALRF